MAGEQRRLAHAAKRDSTSMKILSLLGAIFLPATYLASVFGMTFFEFLPDGDRRAGSGGSDATDSSSSPRGPVAPELWIYFAITVPMTLIIVLLWWWWDRRRDARHAKEDADVEQGIEKMEGQIMAMMRKRTMNKVRTWDAGKE